MDGSPGTLADLPAHVEAARDDRHDVKGELADGDRGRCIRRCERDRDGGWSERVRVVAEQQEPVQAGQRQADEGKVLVQGEADRPVRDRVEQLRRQQQAVDDGSSDREVGEEAGGAHPIPGELAWREGRGRTEGAQRLGQRRADDAPQDRRQGQPSNRLDGPGETAIDGAAADGPWPGLRHSRTPTLGQLDHRRSLMRPAARASGVGPGSRLAR